MLNLPAELIYLIIQQIPSPGPIAYHSSHIVTRTLWACTLVSTGFSAVATPLLYSRCAYLDDEKRLQQFTWNVSDNPKLARRVESLVIDFHHMDPDTCVVEKGSCVHQRLYIAISDLLWPVRNSLRRLMVDMPMRLLPMNNCISFSTGYLHRAFIGLTNIEELCSVRDELFFGFGLGMPVWANWTHLKRLALYNVNLSGGDNYTTGFIDALDRRKSTITHLALPRPDGYDYSERPGYHDLQLGGPGSVIERVLIIDDHKSNKHMISEIAAITEGPRKSNEVPEVSLVSSIPAEGPNNMIEVVQDWVKGYVLDGTLWDIEGILLKRVPTIYTSSDDE